VTKTLARALSNRAPAEHRSAGAPAVPAVQMVGVLVSQGGGGPDGSTDLSMEVYAAVHGDEVAFCALYRAVQPGLLRYLRALVGQDAEDVASETWLQIARDLRCFRGDGVGFRAWVASAARRRAMDHLRRQDRRPTRIAPPDEFEHVADDRDTETQAVDSVSTDAAVALIASLPRDQAEAVLLRVVVGLDAKTAGMVLGKRAGAVRIAAHRGLRRLARELEKCSGAGALRSEAITTVRAGRSGLIGRVTAPPAAAPKDVR
jgi:RNA polymerase sigma-70 factor (ECF subfamily)